MDYARQSAVESVLYTRRVASLFDVSHMLQTEFKGPKAAGLLSRLLPVDLERLENGACRLALFLNPQGGIIDDAIVTKLEEHDYRVVTNAARAGRIIEHLKGAEAAQGAFSVLRSNCLFALQGPEAAKVLDGLFAGISGLKRMSGRAVGDTLITRTGYTGEDGFEISVPGAKAQELAEAIVSKNVRLAGLVARDILRLEAGYLLNTQDMDEDTLPSEVGLGWTVSKDRDAAGDFVGAPLAKKPKALVALIAHGQGPPARSGAVLRDGDGARIGRVTSGGYSPMLEKRICLARVDSPAGTAGAFGEIPGAFVEIRGKAYRYETTGLPFYKPGKTLN